MLIFILLIFLFSFMIMWFSYLNLLMMLEGLMLCLMYSFFVSLSFFEGMTTWLFLFFLYLVFGGVYGLCLVISFSSATGEETFYSNYFF